MGLGVRSGGVDDMFIYVEPELPKCLTAILFGAFEGMPFWR